MPERTDVVQGTIECDVPGYSDELRLDGRFKTLFIRVTTVRTLTSFTMYAFMSGAAGGLPALNTWASNWATPAYPVLFANADLGTISNSTIVAQVDIRGVDAISFGSTVGSGSGSATIEYLAAA